MPPNGPGGSFEPASAFTFLWSIADLLRDDYKQADYGKVILPFTVVRRVDCVLAPTQPAVLAELSLHIAQGVPPDPFLRCKAGTAFYNTSPLDMARLNGDQDNIAPYLYACIQAFSPEVRDIFERFEFAAQIDRLSKAGLLYAWSPNLGHGSIATTLRDYCPVTATRRAGLIRGMGWPTGPSLAASRCATER